jgi:hypothetical protein
MHCTCQRSRDSPGYSKGAITSWKVQGVNKKHEPGNETRRGKPETPGPMGCQTDDTLGPRRVMHHKRAAAMYQRRGQVFQCECTVEKGQRRKKDRTTQTKSRVARADRTGCASQQCIQHFTKRRRGWNKKCTCRPIDMISTRKTLV